MGLGRALVIAATPIFAPGEANGIAIDAGRLQRARSAKARCEMSRADRRMALARERASRASLATRPEPRRARPQRSDSPAFSSQALSWRVKPTRG
jgi:hypothetical protein